MKAVYLRREGFEIRDVPAPVCNEDQMLIRTLSCGVCEGDVFHYRTRADLAEPILLGHEGSGEVVAVGANVDGFAPGDLVTTNDGAYAEYFLTTPAAAIKLPAEVDVRWALGEPIACFVHASRRFGIQPGDKVAVLGCGYMGMGCLQMAKLQQPGTLTAIEPQDKRRSHALSFGATDVYDPGDKPAQQVLEDLGEFDVVIEATGAAPAVDLCTLLVKQHGRIVLVGYHQSHGGQRTIDMKTWNYKAIDVMNGHVRREDEKVQAMREGINLYAQGKLRFEGMLAGYDGLDQVQTAFHDAASGKAGLYKAVIHTA